MKYMKNLSKCQETLLWLNNRKLISHKNCYKLTCVKVNFTEKLEKDGATLMFFLTENQQKIILNFSEN